MSALFSAGPWRAEAWNETDVNPCVRSRDGYFVATVHRHPGFTTENVPASRQDNAVLLAAAWELLAELVRLRQWAGAVMADGVTYTGDHPLATSAAVIAKATGGSA